MTSGKVPKMLKRSRIRSESFSYTFVDRALVDQVQHIDAVPPLPGALDPPDALFEAKRVPRQIHIDQCSQRLLR
jgi:hypothetical protein